MRKKSCLRSIEALGAGRGNLAPTIGYASASVGVGFPNPLGRRALNYEVLHINANTL